MVRLLLHGDGHQRTIEKDAIIKFSTNKWHISQISCVYQKKLYICSRNNQIYHHTQLS